MGRGRGRTETRNALNRLKRKRYSIALQAAHCRQHRGYLYNQDLSIFCIVNFTFPEIPTNTILTGSKGWDTDKIFSHHFQKKLKFLAKLP